MCAGDWMQSICCHSCRSCCVIQDQLRLQSKALAVTGVVGLPACCLCHVVLQRHTTYPNCYLDAPVQPRHATAAAATCSCCCCCCKVTVAGASDQQAHTPVRGQQTRQNYALTHNQEYPPRINPVAASLMQSLLSEDCPKPRLQLRLIASRTAL
jgi:hypothetical protein